MPYSAEALSARNKKICKGIPTGRQRAESASALYARPYGIVARATQYRYGCTYRYEYEYDHTYPR